MKIWKVAMASEFYYMNVAVVADDEAERDRLLLAFGEEAAAEDRGQSGEPDVCECECECGAADEDDDECVCDCTCKTDPDRHEYSCDKIEEVEEEEADDFLEERKGVTLLESGGNG